MKEKEEMMPMVKVTKITPIRLDSSPTKALVDVVIAEHFVVRGIRIVEGSKGLFIAMPSRKIKEGEYVDMFYPETKEARELLYGAVKMAYQFEKRKLEAIGHPIKSTAAAALLLLCISSQAFAQSATTVVNGINSVLQLLISILGPGVLGYGLIRGFVAHSTGDEDGMRSARNAVVGGLGILFTFTLVKLIVKAAGVTF